MKWRFYWGRIFPGGVDSQIFWQLGEGGGGPGRFLPSLSTQNLVVVIILHLFSIFIFILNPLTNFFCLYIKLVYLLGSLMFRGLSCNMVILHFPLNWLCILFFHFSFIINQSPHASSLARKHVMFWLFRSLLIFDSCRYIVYLQEFLPTSIFVNKILLQIYYQIFFFLLII